MVRSSDVYEFFQAARSGNLSRLEDLLPRIADDQRDPLSGRTALQVAAENGHSDIVERLLQEERFSNEAATEPEYWKGVTALHLAASNGHQSVVQALLPFSRSSNWQETIFPFSRGEKAARCSWDNIFSGYAPTPLHLAAKEGHWEVVRQIVAFLHTGNLEVTLFFEERSPLHVAARYGHARVVELLIEEPCVLDVPSLEGFLHSALRLAAHEAHLDVVKLLTAKESINLNLKSIDGLTALHLAAQSGSTMVVEHLLTYPSIDLNCMSNPEGFTPLHMSADRGHDEVVQLLLRHDLAQANPMSRDVMGRTALHYAARQGHESVVQILLTRSDIDANCPDYDGFTPLHLAARGGHRDVVRSLLRHPQLKVNPRARTSILQQSCFELAFVKREMYVVDEKALIRFPRPRLVDSIFWETGGFTPLHFATRYAHRGVVEELLSHKSIDVLLRDDTGFYAYDWCRISNPGSEELFFRCVNEQQLRNGNCVMEDRLLKSEMESEKIGMERLVHPWEGQNASRIRSYFDVNGSWRHPSLGERFLLHGAARAGSMNLLRWLLAQEDTDVNEDDDYGLTALEWAMKNSQFDAAVVLLGNPRVKQDRFVQLVLETLDQYGRDSRGSDGFEEFMQFLVKHGSLESQVVRALAEGINPKDEVGEYVKQSMLKSREARKELMEDRQLYVDSANTILVGAALIASVAYQGWLQPPLGYSSGEGGGVGYASVEEHAAVRWFWWLNSFGFYFAIGTVIAGAVGAMPVDSAQIEKAVGKVRRGVMVAGFLLSMSLICVMLAFATAGLAVLPPTWRERRMMVESAGVGGVVCVVLLVWFFKRLSPLLRLEVGRLKDEVSRSQAEVRRQQGEFLGLEIEFRGLQDDLSLANKELTRANKDLTQVEVWEKSMELKGRIRELEERLKEVRGQLSGVLRFNELWFLDFRFWRSLLRLGFRCRLSLLRGVGLLLRRVGYMLEAA